MIIALCADTCVYREPLSGVLKVRLGNIGGEGRQPREFNVLLRIFMNRSNTVLLDHLVGARELETTTASRPRPAARHFWRRAFSRCRRAPRVATPPPHRQEA